MSPNSKDKQNSEEVVKYADAIEFQFKMKRKIEKLLTILIDHYNIQNYISGKYQFRFKSMDELSHTILYKNYMDNRDKDGIKLPYDQRYDIFFYSFEQWLSANFHDYINVSNLYVQFIRYKLLSGKIMDELNELYEKYTNNSN